MSTLAALAKAVLKDATSTTSNEDQLFRELPEKLRLQLSAAEAEVEQMQYSADTSIDSMTSMSRTVNVLQEELGSVLTRLSSAAQAIRAPRWPSLAGL